MGLDKVFTFENLYEAHKNCRKSKQHKGEVIRFEVNLSYNIDKIIKEIKTKKYKLGSYKRFKIYEPKERIIEAPPYRDRVVIRCLCDNLLKEKIEKRLIYDNAACRKGKGVLFSIKRLERFLHYEYNKEKNNNFYFLKCDIKKYFPSINHGVLIDILETMDFTDDEMWFLKKIILFNDSLEGLPLGNQTSQWFALLYLNKIDRLIKEKFQIKGYIRYMDDMILISRDKKYLNECLLEINRVCNDELKLLLNQKTQIGKVKDGIDFLGYRHIINENGKIIRKLRASSKIRMNRHLKTLEKLKDNGTVDSEYVNIRKSAFYNHIKDTNESNDFKNKFRKL